MGKGIANNSLGSRKTVYSILLLLLFDTCDLKTLLKVHSRFQQVLISYDSPVARFKSLHIWWKLRRVIYIQWKYFPLSWTNVRA